jgi:hypothetical protein
VADFVAPFTDGATTLPATPSQKEFALHKMRPLRRPDPPSVPLFVADGVQSVSGRIGRESVLLVFYEIALTEIRETSDVTVAVANDRKWRISVVPELRNERPLSAISDIRFRHREGPFMTLSGHSIRV